MTQSEPHGGEPRRTPASTPDIDALLSALNAETQRPAQDDAAQRAMAERQAGEIVGRRMQALIRAFDVLHKQVASIAQQGETISGVADAQARQEQTLGDLQRSMRTLRSIVAQQLQNAAPPPQVPQLKVKMVVRHLAESYHQAEHDAGVLSQFAMLFLGLGLGAAVGAGMGVLNRFTTLALVLGTAAVLALLVAVIFMMLARQSRRRAEQIRRSMDESTLAQAAAAEE